MLHVLGDVMMRTTAVLVTGFFVAACGGSDDSTTSGSSGAGAGSTSATTGAGGDTTTSTSSGQGGGDTYSYSPPDLRGQMVVGHYLGDYELISFDTSDPSSASSEVEPGAPTSGIQGIAKHGVVAVAMEGGETLQVFDAATMMPIAGSPYATGNAPVDVAHDDRRDLLYVYCIGTEGDPSKSLLTVYDTSSVPYVEVDGSPFDVDVPATQIDVDPVSGHVFGVSLFTYWGVAFDGVSVTHLQGSPKSLEEGTGADLAVDPARRRLYVGERIVTGLQNVHVLDLDQLQALSGSPVTIPGSALGDLALNPKTGDLWAVDFGSTTLHSIQADPLQLRNSCGTMGCFIPTTETGLALDYEQDRLFIVHVPDLNEPDAGNGFLTAWDVSNPEAPTEITVAGQRPGLSVYPVAATAL